jgi:hypothetical protein
MIFLHKKYIYIIFLSFVCSIVKLSSQTNDSTKYLSENLNIRNNTYYHLGMLRSLESSYIKNDSFILKYYFIRAILNSSIGNHRQSQIDFAIYKKRANNLYITNGFGILNYQKIRKYEPCPTSVVFDKFSRNRIIILNEAPNSPQNRVTLIKNLHLFYKKGFRYLALESVKPYDKNLNSRGFALATISGSYLINEPVYGDLIRIAIKTGFKIIGYNIDSAGHEERATYINKNILSLDKNSKVIIFSLFSHGLTIEEPPMLGYYLRKITGITPVFFEQSQLTESSDSLIERKDYKFITNNFKIDEPIFLINKEKELWKLSETDGNGGLFNPRTILYKGRPNWLLYGNKSFVDIEINCNIQDFPVLVQAYNSAEGINSIACDQVEMNSKNIVTLALNKGNYDVIIRNKMGEIIHKQKNIIK